MTAVYDKVLLIFVYKITIRFLFLVARVVKPIIKISL
jgi:hypothetical protein